MAEQSNSDAAKVLLRSPAGGIPPLIDTRSGLRRAHSILAAGEGPVAVDTERAQGYRYGGGAYLVQLRREGAPTVLIDSHALPDLSSLADVMQGPWILHAADQDLRCMTDLGLVAPGLFDTEIAGRLLGLERFSLGALTEQVLGVTLEKSHQNEDWSLRPLPIDWLRYAALDVELLPQLRKELTARLKDAGRWEWAEQEFAYALAHPLEPKVPRWRDLKGLGRIRTRQGLAIARELWTTREQLGERLDVAPGRLLAASAIVDASVLNPMTKRRLSAIEPFRRPRARKHTDLWWQAIARARALPEADLPKLREKPDLNRVPAAATWKRHDPIAWSRLQSMRGWAQRAANPLGISPEVLLTPRIQREVAWWALDADVEDALRSAGARQWQIDNLMPAYTKEVEKILRTPSVTASR